MKPQRTQKTQKIKGSVVKENFVEICVIDGKKINWRCYV